MTNLQSANGALPQLKSEIPEIMRHLGTARSNRIKIRGKTFVLPTGESSPGPLSVVVLDSVWLLRYFATAWEPEENRGPDCWALGRERPESGLLKPHIGAQRPLAANCAVCPKNQWRSGRRSGAKACKNARRLVVVPPDATPDTEPLTLHVSPTGLKAWDAYVTTLARVHELHPIQAVTEIAFSDRAPYPTLTFKLVSTHGNVATALTLRKKAEAQLWKPISTTEIAD